MAAEDVLSGSRAVQSLGDFTEVSFKCSELSMLPWRYSMLLFDWQSFFSRQPGQQEKAQQLRNKITSTINIFVYLQENEHLVSVDSKNLKS